MYTSLLFLDNKLVCYAHSQCSGGCGNMWDQATYPATVTKECPQFGSEVLGYENWLIDFT
jgi:hypothetical protein